jgi:gamma-glutamyltranspeptidase/glutathione hydrolase
LKAVTCASLLRKKAQFIGRMIKRRGSYTIVFLPALILVASLMFYALAPAAAAGPSRSDSAAAQQTQAGGTGPLSPALWTASEMAQYSELNKTYGLPSSLASEGNVMIGSTSGPLAIHAGFKTLEAGGSAADAAIATALTQITLVAGSWTSFAGMLYAVYFDAATGNVYSLNAGFNTVLEEDDPLSIPKAPNPSGRTAMTGGFMAGVQELHGRFGKLPFAELFEPSIYFAEEGFGVDSFMAKIIAAKRDVLTRTPEGRAIFVKEGPAEGEDVEARAGKDSAAGEEVPPALAKSGSGPRGDVLKLYGEGDTLRQPELAETLRQIASHGADYMYTGPWAEKFVEAVQREGGHMTMKDLRSYKTELEEPLKTTYHGDEVNTVGLPELGAVQLLEAINLLELAGFKGPPHYSEDPETLYRFIQLCRLGYAVTYSPAYRPFGGPDAPIPWISPQSRIAKETAKIYWERLQDKNWELKLFQDLTPGADHSDGIIVVDSAGNVAAVVHSINTSLWGSTGLFVDGVSIPDPASFQQNMVAKAGPGVRFPNVVNPVIVTRNGRPLLAACAIGNALHECMLQHLVNILDYGMDPEASVEAPKFWGPMWGGAPEDYGVQAVDAGAFSEECLAAVREMGQPLKELDESERKKRVSYWVGVEIDPQTGELGGAVSPDFNGIFETDQQ